MLLNPGCAPVMHPARLDRAESPSDRELEAAGKVHAAQCNPRWGSLWPGAAQYCYGAERTGLLLAGLGAAELGTAITAAINQNISAPAAAAPLLAFGDLLTLGVMDAVLEQQRADKLLFVPQENLGELAAAPFSSEVLSRPGVFLGIAGTLAAGLLVSRITDGPLSTQGFGKRPVLFGQTVNSSWGYPVAVGIGVGLFEHVALAEETAFRGVLQSGWARRYGEDRGLIYGSLAFGLIHSTNIFFMDSSQRVSYLLVGVPFITLLGSYLGYEYRASGYSLAPSVAIHFWYDFLIEAVSFVLDPKNSPLALSYATPL